MTVDANGTGVLLLQPGDRIELEFLFTFWIGYWNHMLEKIVINVTYFAFSKEGNMVI